MTSTPESDLLALLVVGLGGTGGSSSEIGKLFSAARPGSGISYVLLMNPPHPDIVSHLRASGCPLPVLTIERATPPLPDHIHVLPPEKLLSMRSGLLMPSPVPQEGKTFPIIDFFLRSLSLELGDLTAGVMLSGTGSDGSLGLAAIKAAGGLVLASRDPGPPVEAIASAFREHAAKNQHRTTAMVDPAEGSGNEALDYPEIFRLLELACGNDFSTYKPNTVRRRIERRMACREVAAPSEYLEILKRDPEEILHLVKELLIGVTSFFRDPEAFQALRAHLLERLKGRKSDEVVRVWTPGCSTGEEAYSLAILLKDLGEEISSSFRCQIFATDLDPGAIEIARLGLFPANIARHVPSGFLSRFFVPADGAFRIRRDVRDMVVFAKHNLIEDPPFTRLDLISCRNLLIYFHSTLQQTVLPILHMALNPGGLLLLGAAESLGETAPVFEEVDRRWKIFRRREGVRGREALAWPCAHALAAPEREPRPSAVHRTTPHERRVSLDRLLLEHLVPPTVVMRENGEVVHIHGKTGQFLEPAPGPQTSPNAFDMLRPGLELDLALSLRQASTGAPQVIRRDLELDDAGRKRRGTLRVIRVEPSSAEQALYLVTFEEVPGPPETDDELPPTRSLPPERLEQLQRELTESRKIHHSTIGELETANQELRVLNEEFQSTNEEMQSANEELETSKEEMQSLNEELQTINAELHSKVLELSQANDDVKNLLNGTDIATLFLDEELRIKRYTESARKVIRLIPSDIGRPLEDLAAHLQYPGFLEDAREVLRTLEWKEKEVRGAGDVWYLLRIIPYRTVANEIAGLVVTLVDISKIKDLKEASQRILAALRNSPTTVFWQDLSLRYIWTLSPVFGTAPPEVVGKTDLELLPPEDADRLIALKRRVISEGASIHEQLRLSAGTTSSSYDIFLEPLRGDRGEVTGISGVVTRIDEGTTES